MNVTPSFGLCLFCQNICSFRYERYTEFWPLFILLKYVSFSYERYTEFWSLFILLKYVSFRSERYKCANDNSKPNVNGP